MATGRWILSPLPLAILSVLAACGGGSTANVQNPQDPPSSSVSIAFQPAPASSISINTPAALTAVVSNDPSNAGVDWSLICSNATNCGSLTALHTASGAPTTYTPASTFAGNTQSVSIVAFATANHNQNVVAGITVTAFGSNLKGRYVFQGQGVDISSGPYEFAGVVVLNGNGGITSGEQTVNFFDQNPNISALVSRSDPITGGSYFIGPDGRGTMTITTGDLDIGQNGVETFSLVYLSASRALIAETDPAESGTGTMDLQGTIAPPSGGYAFVVSGTDIPSASPTAFGGVFNINSPNTISGAGSIADQNLAGTVTGNQALSGTVSPPDAFGAVTLNLTVPGFQSATTFQFAGYIVDATHIKLIENDNNSGGGSGSTGGIAIAQGTATGTFANDSSFSGTYVFGLLGVDLTGFTPNTLTSAGVFTANGSGNFDSGYMDTFLQQNGSQGTAGSQISVAFSGNYSVYSKTGRVRAVFDNFLPRQKLGYAPVYFFYLTGNGNPVLFIDGSDSTLHYPSVGAGIAYPQSAPPFTFQGDYGFSFTQQNGSENDGTGRLTAVSTAGTLSGVADNNSAFTPTSASPISGTFAAPASNGVSAGTLSGSPPFDFSPFAVDYYVIGPTQGFFVETDLVSPNDPSGVVSFGYYAARTPVCSSCL